MPEQIGELREAIGELREAIDKNDFAAVRSLMTADPTLHRAPLGYRKSGPLTWVAECRVPWGPPTQVRLDMAAWMIENGSDVHQGGDGPLMRAALRGERIPMMDLLVRHGADVNAEWNGNFPILFAPCETVDPRAICRLLEHGADPNCPKPGRAMTALDYLIGSYVRSDDLGACIELLRSAGGTSRYDLPGVLDTMIDRRDGLAALIEAQPELVHRRFPELICGSTGARRLLLEGGTLLHVAAEFGSVECARLLIAQGADVNGAASVKSDGSGGQTAIFHAVTQYNDGGLAVTELLLRCGADLSVRAKLPGHYERLDELLECTPVEYAVRFPGPEFPGSNEKTVQLLQRS